MSAFTFLVKHKIAIGLAVVAIGGGGYAYVHAQQTTKPLQYVLSPVTKQTIITSVSAAGQVSGENQLDLKPTVSGKITKLSMKPGDLVTTSTVLATIDATEAQKAIRDAAQSVTNARLSVQSAELSFQKLKEPPDSLSLTQSQHSVDQAQRSLEALRKGADPLDIQQAERSYQLEADKIALSSDGATINSVRDAYDAAVVVIKNASQSLQTSLRDVSDGLNALGQSNLNGSYEYSRLLSATDPNQPTGDNLYQNAKSAGTELKPKADSLLLVNANVKSIDDDLLLARAGLASTGLFLQKFDEMLLSIVPSASLSQSTIDSMRSAIRSDRSDVLSKTTAITTAIQAIENAKTSVQSQQVAVEKAKIALDKLKQGPDADDVATAEERLTEAKASLAKLKQGPTAIDIANAQNSISQRRADLVTAQSRYTDAVNALKDYTIHAPFEGMVASVPVRLGDQVSGSTVLGTILTKAKIVSIPLNEVDVSKVAVGQKATLTFDALPDISIAGSVTQIDAVGTVSQGVVNYNVKVAFLTEDDHIKPGMSASVAVITSIRTDVLAVPNAAVQQSGGRATVRLLTNVSATSSASSAQGIASDIPPESRQIEVGSSNDQVTEVVSGLQEGESIVIRTIDPNAQTAATTGTQTRQQTSTLGIPTGGGFGGGAATFRAGGAAGR